MQNKILILGGGIESIKGYEWAHNMGFETISVDINPNAPGAIISNDLICASVYHPNEVLNELKKYKYKKDICAVITIGHDVPHTMGHVSNYLNLPGPSIKTGELCVNKIAMKTIFKENNIPIPWFKKINTFKELKEIYKIKSELVIKPNDSRGSRGVLKLNSNIDLKWAYEISKSYSTSGDLIIEEWIPGPQFSTESIIWDDKAVLCGICDRGYENTKQLYPFIIEDSSMTPALITDRVLEKITELVHNAGRLIGITRGTIKGDIVLSQDGPKIIEITSRLSGGFFSTHTIPAAYGTDFIGEAIKISLGIEPCWDEINTKSNQFVASTVLFVENGRIKKLEYDLKNFINASPILSKVYIKENDVLSGYTNLTERSGLFITTGKSPEAAIARGREIINSIYYEIEK